MFEQDGNSYIIDIAGGPTERSQHPAEPDHPGTSEVQGWLSISVANRAGLLLAGAGFVRGGDVMPDRGNSLPEDAAVPASMVVSLTRMGERLAALEARATVEIAGLKDDTGVIRAAIHGINGEMQRFVQAEQKCADALGQIALQTRDLPVVVSAIASFSEMRPDLRALLEQRAGLGAFGKRFAMIVGAAAALVAFLGGIAGGIVWLAQHLKPL